MKRKVLVGLSGGVDSTVTALLLQKEGYDVEGVYMKLHDNEEYHAVNFAKAERVGAYLAIKVHYLDLSVLFKEKVYDYFVQSYKEGTTPNPCIVCNREIKFGKLVEFADSINADFIATGHYVKCDGRDIYQGEDETKDQSYFLSKIDSSVLHRLLFPLGEWLKSDVKSYARKIEFLEDLADQKESSEICFVEKEYTDILEKHMNIDQEGETLDSQGNVVGSHKGYMHYTIGKRRGFFVDGAHDPHFVLDIRPQTNQIVVGTKEKLEVNSFGIEDINLFYPKSHLECTVKVRYRTAGVLAKVTIDKGFKRASIVLDEPVYGLARGQIAAFYDGNRLLGGGIIC